MFFINPMPTPVPSTLIEQALLVEPATLGHLRLMGFPDPGLACTVNPATVAGTAVTLALPAFDSTLLHHSIESLRLGDVLVIDRLGDRTYACAGGGIAVALRKAGVAGLIVDGPCADPMELEESGLPIWSRGVTALTTRTYGIGGSMNHPVSIGGAVAMPGDLVIADRGGIIFIPASEAAAAVETAIAYQRREALLFPQIGGEIPLGRLTGASDMVERMLARSGD
jgi:4-hydroxy-4-methyl-2-oxoglutarate aldolase